LHDTNDCGLHYGFDIQVPASLQDGKEHRVYVYAIDANFSNYGQGPWEKTGSSLMLPGSPKSFRIGLPANAPRHARGALVQDGNTIYFIGEQLRYPFPNSVIFLSWGANFSQVVQANAGDLAMPIGPVVQQKTQPQQSVEAKNRLPMGKLDDVDADGILRGWILDMDAPSSSIDYHIYLDGPQGQSMEGYKGIALFQRPDVNAAFGVSGNHGLQFDLSLVPDITYDVQHTAYVYSLDANDGMLTLVNGSPMTFMLSSSPANQNTYYQRDLARVQKVRQIMTSLEIYFNDFQTYPDGIDLVLDNEYLGPNGWTTTASGATYMTAVGAPPAADNTCTAAQNEFRYSKTSAHDYKLTFCLGGYIMGYSAGPRTASPAGIN
jgi:hypothetical protein